MPGMVREGEGAWGGGREEGEEEVLNRWDQEPSTAGIKNLVLDLQSGSSISLWVSGWFGGGAVQIIGSRQLGPFGLSGGSGLMGMGWRGRGGSPTRCLPTHLSQASR